MECGNVTVLVPEYTVLVEYTVIVLFSVLSLMLAPLVYYIDELAAYAYTNVFVMLLSGWSVLVLTLVDIVSTSVSQTSPVLRVTVSTVFVISVV